MSVKGSCNCGSVKFEIGVAVSDVYVCHCSICRKSTGSGGIAVAIIGNNELSWVEGKEFVRTWHKPNHDWESSFCTNCGSPLPGKNDDNTTYLPVSLLDTGYERLKVKHHIFVESKAPWEELVGSATKHQNDFGE